MKKIRGLPSRNGVIKMISFYWPIGKISGELYIGKGAGKRLLRYVDNAQKSVKVFSPYMSASFISTLFNKSEQGVNVECVTQIVSDTEDKQLSKDTFGLDRIHRRCIKQTAYVNQEKQNEKERRLRNAHKSLKLSLGLLVAALLCFLLSIASFQNFIAHSLSETIKESNRSFGVISPALFFWLFIFLAIFSLCVFLTANSNRKLAESISTSEFQYDFTKKFCLLSTRANKSGMPFPHLKLLIVDEKTAFLGSLNFTVSGINNNLESCVRIDDPASISQLSSCFNDLYEELKPYALSADYLGKYYFEKKTTPTVH